MTDNTSVRERPESADENSLRRFVTAVQQRAPLDAAEMLAHESDATVACVLNRLHPTLALKVMLRLPERHWVSSGR